MTLERSAKLNVCDLESGDVLEIDSLKQFTIPKRKIAKTELLELVAQNSHEYQNDILQTIKRSFKDVASSSQFVYSRPRLVHNSRLLDEFVQRKKDMRSDGYTEKDLKETFGFLYFGTEYEARRVCENGVKTNNKPSLQCLGNPQMGVYLSKHADVISPEPLRPRQCGVLVVFKIIKGRVKFMKQGNGQDLEPTPNFDCHQVKSSCIDGSSSLHRDLYEASQMYIYEYDKESELASCPRQILPYAVLNLCFTGLTNSEELRLLRPQIPRMSPKSDTASVASCNTGHPRPLVSAPPSKKPRLTTLDMDSVRAQAVCISAPAQPSGSRPKIVSLLELQGRLMLPSNSGRPGVVVDKNIVNDRTVRTSQESDTSNQLGDEQSSGTPPVGAANKIPSLLDIPTRMVATSGGCPQGLAGVSRSKSLDGCNEQACAPGSPTVQRQVTPCAVNQPVLSGDGSNHHVVTEGTNTITNEVLNVELELPKPAAAQKAETQKAETDSQDQSCSTSTFDTVNHGLSSDGIDCQENSPACARECDTTIERPAFERVIWSGSVAVNGAEICTAELTSYCPIKHQFGSPLNLSSKLLLMSMHCRYLKYLKSPLSHTDEQFGGGFYFTHAVLQPRGSDCGQLDRFIAYLVKCKAGGFIEYPKQCILLLLPNATDMVNELGLKCDVTSSVFLHCIIVSKESCLKTSEEPGSAASCSASVGHTGTTQNFTASAILPSVTFSCHDRPLPSVPVPSVAGRTGAQHDITSASHGSLTAACSVYDSHFRYQTSNVLSH